MWGSERFSPSETKYCVVIKSEITRIGYTCIVMQHKTAFQEKKSGAVTNGKTVKGEQGKYLAAEKAEIYIFVILHEV